MGGLTLGKYKHAQHPQLLYLPSLLSLTLRPNLAQQEAFSVLPVPPVLLFRWLPDTLLLSLLSGILMPTPVHLHDLCPWTLMSLPHLQPLLLPSVPTGLPKTLETETASFVAQCLLWTTPSSFSFSDLIVENLTHYLIFGGKRDVFEYGAF